MLKARKGLIKCKVRYDDIEKIIYSVDITGDFFFYPEDALEELMNRLKNIEIDKKIIRNVIKTLYKEYSISSPGLTIDDITEVIYRAAGEGSE